ncbi:MAG: bifunctional phosphoribosyl-AMP cyclohydrolase/phosphoribosyl-ATP diphosphatase HisIE [Flavobacterium sp.]|nr:MAG: bifunctional phosphoribosyl-AMP cyclohydrolase/phosphoribosyl-ATP diphosphatase HisIE [Flavobacterium sp.]
MNIEFNKYQDGLVPVIVQDFTTRNVLMLGFMNEEALAQTIKSKRVTFFSRKKNRLWTKGSESGNYLNLVSIKSDCDNDTLLAMVHPQGPVCHKGTDNCWGEQNTPNFGFLSHLEEVIRQRKDFPEMEDSYVASLFKGGVNKIAQKVGEEAVELVIEAKDDNDLAFLNEAADLLFHTLILLQTKGLYLRDVDKTLQARHKVE